MALNRDELFKKSSMIHKEEQKQKEERKNFKFDPIDYASLETNQIRVFRFLGLPANISVGIADPFSPKVINYSMLLGDNDKKFRCIWPLKKENDTWILWKVYDFVMSYTWDTRKNQPNYIYSDSHPTIFDRVNKNNNIHNSYESGWKPKTLVIPNVIDRENMKFHIENKQTVVLAKKASEREGASTFYEPGIPWTCYSMIVEEIQEKWGDWENYDIGVLKLKKEPWYKVYHIEDDWKDINDKIDGSFIKNATRLLTEEERSWERYDISKLFKITSYQKIKKRIGKFIETVDEVFHKHFSEELDYLVEKEKKEIEELKEKEMEDVVKTMSRSVERKAETVEKTVVEVKNERPLVEIRERPKVITKTIKDTLKEIANKKLSGEKKDETSYIRFVGVDKLIDSEINSITEINEEELYFVYTTESGQVYECNDCKFEAPISFAVCPDCGKEFN